MPTDAARIVEPFAGSAALSLAAASCGKAERFLLNDRNVPLIELWRQIVEMPDAIASQYRALWEAQIGQESAYYNWIRDEFNLGCRPDHLLYLLARCVKAAVRYNVQGQFNQSPDKRRRGMHPDTMARNLRHTSALLKGRASFSADDYRVMVEYIQPGDFVYLDPPYQGVSGKRDARYLAGVRYEDLVELLCTLNERRIAYVLSYDGRTGSKAFGRPLPDSLRLEKRELYAGRSTQATLLGQAQTTYETLYLSPALRIRLDSENIP